MTQIFKRASAGVLAFGVFGLVICASPATADEKSCIRVWGESRYVIGYDHIVHIFNACSDDVVCGVSTDVNERVTQVRVPKGREAQVTTFLGSPSGKFTARVSCELEPR